MRPRRIRQSILITVLSLIALVGIAPYLFMLLTSFKNNAEYYKSYFAIPKPFHWENYLLAWRQISDYFLNSLIVAVASIIGVLVLGAISSFVMARYEFPAKRFLYWMIIALMSVPGITTLIPLFILIKNMGLIDHRLSLILPYIATGQIMSIFLMRTFFENLPEEVFEAATIDGANGFRLFWNLAIPLSKPIISTIAMISFLGVWNDYVWPSVVIASNQLRTITIGLAFFQGEFLTEWGQLFAGYVIASIPLLIVFAFGMRYFVSGLTGGVVK
ncbi:carbohydrate ABC transporter permease [Alicyclobacillus fodiniaquatilis]|uniref:Carbohydrate ABC transporter permease n=1 Tax=Alicyclobacillus fodiniaquatilis TaxID=1661150 RepID=A0ABW4JPR3_9BACL